MFPGTLAALGIVSALLAARRSGQGQFLDVAMYDAVLSLCENIVYKYSLEGHVEGPKGEGHPLLCPFGVYQTKDGAVAIAAPTAGLWKILCKKMGRDDLIADRRLKDVGGRVTHRLLVDEAVGLWTQDQKTSDVVRSLGGEVPVGPVNSVADIFADPHVKIRNMLVEVEQPGKNAPLMLAGSPIKLKATPAGIYRRPPRIGEHTREILAEAGLPVTAEGIP